MSDASARKSQLGLHVGNMFHRLAKTYPTLALMLVESVQNAIDADASRVFVGVDLIEGRIAILDNGSGATMDKFHEALMSVGDSIKTPKPGTLGQFGIGLISPLDKCQSFWFASRPRGEDHVNAWKFEGEKIFEQRDMPTVPHLVWDDFIDLPDPFKYAHKEVRPLPDGPISWSTMVLLDRVTQDKAIGLIDPDEIENLIRTKLGRGMRFKNTRVTLLVRRWRKNVSSPRTDRPYTIIRREIDPKTPTGQPLAVVTYDGEKCGKVEFELYKARSIAGKRSGEVEFTTLPGMYPVTMAEFILQAAGAGYYNTKEPKNTKGFEEVTPAIQALSDGYFEGTIRCENVRLNEARNRFEFDDALIEFYDYLAIWYDKVGKTLIGDENEIRSEKRYQSLGEQSLKRLLDELLSNPDLASLARTLSGTLPRTPTSQPEPVEKREGKKDSSESTDDRSSQEPNRKVVVRPPRPAGAKPRSPAPTFISYSYEPLRGSNRLWEYDLQTGLLTFNIRHPLWVRVDEINGKHTPRTNLQVMRLQEYLTLKLLLLLARADGSSVDETTLEIERLAIDRELLYYVPVVVLA